MPKKVEILTGGGTVPRRSRTNPLKRERSTPTMKERMELYDIASVFFG